jgi:hypothetical protein
MAHRFRQRRRGRGSPKRRNSHGSLPVQQVANQFRRAPQSPDQFDHLVELIGIGASKARPLTGWSARIGRTIGRLAIITGEAIPGSVIVTGFASKACRLASYVIGVAVTGPIVFERESANDRLPDTLSFRPSP